MGLIRSAITSVTGVLSDQWKEYFVCESIPADYLIVRGEHKGSNSLFGGNHGNPDVITNGSGIVVADGQCLILVDQGKVTEVCSEPGVYTYDASSEPSFFVGNLKEGVQNVIEVIKKRFEYGGEVPQDQRVYYVNTKEIVNNTFGTPNPIPFKIADKDSPLKLEVGLRCNGVYSYRIINPIAFYETVAGNVTSVYTKSQLDGQLRSEFISALQPVMTAVGATGVMPSDLPAHTEEISKVLDETLSEKWAKARGLEVVSVAFNSITLNPEDQKRIQDYQAALLYSDQKVAAGHITDAYADAIRDAAKNEAGAVNGFVGVGLANNAAGVTVNQLFNNGNNAPAAYCPSCGKEIPAGSNFCPYCGKQL